MPDSPVPQSGRSVSIAGARRSAWVGWGYLLVVLIWGTTWFGIETQVNGTSPHLAVASRMGIASLIFFAIALSFRQPLRLTRNQARQVLVQGICFFGFNYLAVYAGTQYLTSGVVAVLFSTVVPLNILVEWLFYGERPRLATMLAATAGVAGIALLFSTDLRDAALSNAALWGAGLVIASTMLVAVGNVLATRLVSGELSPLVLNAYGTAAGTASILLWGAVTGAPWSMTITPTWIMGLSYLSMIGTVLAFGIYMKLLPIVGSVAGAYVAVLSPIVAISISILLEDLPLTVVTFAGVLLLLAGHSLLVTQRKVQRDD